MDEITVEVKKIKLSEIKLNQDNPRTITTIEMERLEKSLSEFPDMAQIREIILDEDMLCIGGTMRALALQKIGKKTCTVKIVKGLTPDQKREFIVKDNSAFGEWDLELLEAWERNQLEAWGVKLPKEWGPTPDFQPVGEDEQGKLDEITPKVCKECGYTWTNQN